MHKYRPRRSVLYMPASNIRAIEKAKTLPADCLVFDLEDAVAPEQKIISRDALQIALKNGGFGNRELIIRTNSHESEWFNDDILAAISAKVDAILIPKISNKNQILEIDKFVRANNNNQSIDIWVMIESPMAIINIAKICSANQCAPLKALIMGTNDLAKETFVILDIERLPFHFQMSLCVNAARAFGLLVFDGVYNDIEDLEGLERQTQQAKQFGFDGKTLIHPKQIEICNQIFSPSLEEIKRARAIIAAFELPENNGQGAVKVDGQMVEILHLEMSQKAIKISELIQMQTGL